MSRVKVKVDFLENHQSLFIQTQKSLHRPTSQSKGCRRLHHPPHQGHSCNIGNAPNFVEKKLKTVIWVFWMNIWYGITFTKTEKVMGKLKEKFFIYIWQNVWFFCPEETLTIFCKIKCQSFNFLYQALEKPQSRICRSITRIVWAQQSVH